jgi:hypothetical protein
LDTTSAISGALLGAGGATVDPELHLGDGVGTAKRGRRAAVTRIPAPANEIVGRNVFEELLKRAATGLFWIFELAAEFGWGTADEDHFVFGSRKRPFGIAGRHVVACEIRSLMASIAAHAVNAVAVFATFDVLQMNVAVIALQRSVTHGVAILAARRCKDFMDLKKSFA